MIDFCTYMVFVQYDDYRDGYDFPDFESAYDCYLAEAKSCKLENCTSMVSLVEVSTDYNGINNHKIVKSAFRWKKEDRNLYPIRTPMVFTLK